jgi:hypothetical protein
MTLGTTGQGYQDGQLGFRHPGRRQEDKRETRTAATNGCSSLYRLLLPLPGAKASAASAHGPREAVVAHA